MVARAGGAATVFDTTRRSTGSLREAGQREEPGPPFRSMPIQMTFARLSNHEAQEPITLAQFRHLAGCKPQPAPATRVCLAAQPAPPPLRRLPFCGRPSRGRPALLLLKRLLLEGLYSRALDRPVKPTSICVRSRPSFSFTLLTSDPSYGEHLARRSTTPFWPVDFSLPFVNAAAISFTFFYWGSHRLTRSRVPRRGA
jgi:hypothetical protein